MNERALTFQTIFNDGGFYDQLGSYAYTHAEVLFKKLNVKKIIEVLKFKSRNNDIKEEKYWILTETEFIEILFDSDNFSYSTLSLNEIIGADIKISYIKNGTTQDIQTYTLFIRTTNSNLDKKLDLKHSDIMPSRHVDRHEEFLNFKLSLLKRL